MIINTRKSVPLPSNAYLTLGDMHIYPTPFIHFFSCFHVDSEAVSLFFLFENYPGKGGNATVPDARLTAKRLRFILN